MVRANCAPRRRKGSPTEGRACAAMWQAEFGPFMAMGARSLKLRAHERSPQQLYAEKCAAIRRRQHADLALAAQVSLRRISDRTSHLQREADQLARALKQTTLAKARLLPSSSAPTLPNLDSDARPATSQGLGRGRGSGEYNLNVVDTSMSFEASEAPRTEHQLGSREHLTSARGSGLH